MTEEKFVFFDRATLALTIFSCSLVVGMLCFGQQESLDTKLYYTGAQAHQLFASFGKDDVRRYFVTELFDLLLITSYSLLFWIGTKRIFPNSKGAQRFAIVPGYFDFVETFLILYALRVPGAHSFFDWLGIITFLKWFSGTLLVISLLWKSNTKTK